MAVKGEGEGRKQAREAVVLTLSLPFYGLHRRLIETRKTLFLFLLENTTLKKEKQFVYFDYQNVNSPYSHHHYVNCSC